MTNKFDENQISNILIDIKQALNHIQEKYGILISISEPKFSDVYLEAKLSATKVGTEGLIEAERKRYFLENCNSIGLSEEHYGYVFEFFPLKAKVRVIGLDFHNEEYPILLQDINNNTVYRTSTLAFLNSI